MPRLHSMPFWLTTDYTSHWLEWGQKENPAKSTAQHEFSVAMMGCSYGQKGWKGQALETLRLASKTIASVIAFNI